MLLPVALCCLALDSRTPPTLAAGICPSASKGNKTEQSVPLALSVILSAPVIALFAYYLRAQAYV